MTARHETEIVLASGSPRRKELIARLGVPFRIIVSHVDEEEVALTTRPGDPSDMVMKLAEAKARAVARSVSDTALIIGADTIVWLDGEALNKPKDEDQAHRMLRALGGRTHEVYTGIAIVQGGLCSLRPALTDFAVTEVEFHPIPDADARAYVATGEPMDKAGAYGIQDASIGRRFVKEVRGDFDNVVGLPLVLLARMLTDAGFDLTPPGASNETMSGGD
jgi:septum formation protein